MTQRRRRLCFVFVQADRRKYPRSLGRVLELADRFEDWDPHVVVVDNAREGDWEHRVTDRLSHIGGDNSQWEFSAFDRGARWGRDHLDGPELFALVTDACLAYGESYLDLVTPTVAEVAVREGACIGWIDSFLETCELLDREYDAWLRTSFVFVPDLVARRIEPFAATLPADLIFGSTPEHPFRPEAPLSPNLQRLLRSWLTGTSEEGDGAAHTWHSRFDLTVETMPLFQAKVAAILREHLLSARLQAGGVPAYDLRVVDLLRGARNGELVGWEWLQGVVRWRRECRPLVGRGRSEVVLVADLRIEGNERAAACLAFEVMPLIQQRYGAAALRLLGSHHAGHLRLAGRAGVKLTAQEAAGDAWLDSAAALVAAPEPDVSSARAEKQAIERGVPIVRVAEGATVSPSRLASRLCRCFESAAPTVAAP